MSKDSAPIPLAQQRLLSKSIEQTKQLKDLTQENKELKLRVKELERLFVNAKEKLNTTVSKAEKLNAELGEIKGKHEKLEVSCDYYKTMNGNIVKFLGFMSEPAVDRVAISLRYLELDDSYVPIIVKILQQCPHAHTLDLTGNSLTDKGAKVLSEHLQTLECRVVNVELSWNNIGDEGAWELMLAMKKRDEMIANNIAKVSQLHAPQKLAKVNLNYNNLPAHTALIEKTLRHFKSGLKGTVAEMNITKKLLMRAVAKTVGQAFKVVNEAFTEIPEVKSIIGLLDRILIVEHKLTPEKFEELKSKELAKYIYELKHPPPPKETQKQQSEPPSPAQTQADKSQPDNPDAVTTDKAPPAQTDKPQPGKPDKAQPAKTNKPKTSKVHSRHALSTPDLASSLTKELNIPFLLSKRPAFPLSFIEKTITAGLEVNAVDKNLDETLLMYAARTDNIKLAQLVVEKRAILDLSNVRISIESGRKCVYYRLQARQFRRCRLSSIQRE